MAAAWPPVLRREVATFELFVRRLPPNRAFLVAAGIERAIGTLLGLRFDDDALEALASLPGPSGGPALDPADIDLFRTVRFTGDAWAVAEGEVVFAGEPIVRVTAPLVEAQLVETALLNAVLHATSVATKATRVAIACDGRPFSDFSARRDHGLDAALAAARSAFIGGAAATSNVLAGTDLGITVSGTMAHSFVLSFASEEEAFRAYVDRFGEASTLLVDTYDIAQGVRTAVVVAREAQQRGSGIRGVRIDSGDLLNASQVARRILDDAGLRGLQILASGDLDEYEIARLVAAGAPIDAYGVGTRLGVVEDAPSLSGVYKLVELSGRPVAKRSPGKATVPFAKQVMRRSHRGMAAGDTITIAGEDVAGEPLLRQVVRAGERCDDAGPLALARARCAAAVASLPREVRDLRAGPDTYPVAYTPRLAAWLR
jgi:nicotinate phosphoribosyltransferase